MKANKYTAVKAALMGLLAAPASMPLADVVIDMPFGDNVNPSPSFPSTINSTPFTPGTEMRMLDPNGFPGGGIPTDKDIINGTETWSFDGMSGQLTGVINTQITSGVIDAYNYNPDPAFHSPCPSGCEGLTQNTLFFNNTFGFVAPIVGNPAGSQYGAATLNVTGPSSFEVHFPVLEVQWAGFAHFPLGLANNAGVTLTCNGQPTANFRCHLEHTLQASEDPLNIGFVAWTLQMELTSMASAAVSIDVTGGALQECSSHAGNTVMLNANVATSGDVTVTSIDWVIDGMPAGSGASIQPTLSLGEHNIAVSVSTSDGAVTVDSEVVTIQDTTPPVVEPAFVDPFMGTPMENIGGLFTFIQTNFNVTDICDAAPVTEGTLGIPATDGDTLWVTRFDGSVRLKTDTVNMKVIATDASGNIGMGDAALNITD